MKHLLMTPFMLIALILATGFGVSAEPLGTRFTYQGHLEQNGVPANGSVHLRFTGWDSEAGGIQVGPSQILSNVLITNGVFTVVLNNEGEIDPFSINGEERWMEIEVCDGPGCGSPTVLVPRQLLTATPYALHAAGPWLTIPAGLSYGKGRVGIGTLEPSATSRLHVLSSEVGHWAILGGGPSGGIGVAGTSPGGPNARGVYGTVGPGGFCGTSGDHSGSGNYGLLGTENEGVFANSPGGNAVRGVAATGIGLWGSSASNVGVYGTSDSSNGVSGGSGSANGVYGLSGTGFGVFGTSQFNAGVHGVGAANPGVQGISTSSSGVSGSSTSGIGVDGRSDSSHGVSGLSSTGIGVYGQSNSAGGTGVSGVGSNYGVRAQGRTAVYAESTAQNGTAIFGVGFEGGEAGYFSGQVEIYGELFLVGPLTHIDNKSRIDHPLDPESKYLSHASVESPGRLNIYNGNVDTDSEGYAEVVLPEYFEAFNSDYRYQLTVVDGADSDLFVFAKVAKEIQNNRFTIRTSQPNTKVSWLVTGVRNDAYAKAHPIEVEKTKDEKDRGKYLTPEVFGQPKENGIGHRPELAGAGLKDPIETE